MEDMVNFRIKKFGPINDADIDVGKINVIGGHNASGKSTASKLLYCFLKASSSKRQDFAYESLSTPINSALNRLTGDFRFSRKLGDIDFLELLDEYENAKEEYFDSHEYGEDKFIDKDVDDIDSAIADIQENGYSLYFSILMNLLHIEFSSRNLNGHVCLDGRSEDDFFNLSELNSFKFSHKYYFDKVDIYDVFYIDSFSIFDLNLRSSKLKVRNQGYYDHIDYLKEVLKDSEDESKELFDHKKNKSIIDVEEKIKRIINGKIEFDRGRFHYISNDSDVCSMDNTASGIKQIGVIQLLLSNRKLKEDSFLIIDEPEVNLHPEWQFKLAEILVLLVKDLNISIYINTHSPMFIEAIEVFTKYYDLENDTNYYLTESTETGNNFIYIDHDELYELYDSLAEPYIAIEGYRIRTKYKK